MSEYLENTPPEAYKRGVEETLYRESARQEYLLHLTYEFAAATIFVIGTWVLSTGPYDRCVILLAYIIFIYQHHHSYGMHEDLKAGFKQISQILLAVNNTVDMVNITQSPTETPEQKAERLVVATELSKTVVQLSGAVKWYWDLTRVVEHSPRARAILVLSRLALVVTALITIGCDLLEMLTPFRLPV